MIAERLLPLMHLPESTVRHSSFVRRFGLAASLSLICGAAVSVVPHPGQEGGAYVASQALLEGRGDAYDKEQAISRADLRSAGLRKISDLAGSWVVVEPITQHRSMEQHAQLARTGLASGLVVISVLTVRSSESTGQVEPNHFVWNEPKVLQDSGMGPFLMGRGYPSTLIIDPVGLIVAGGEELVTCGYHPELGTAELIRVIGASPGLDASRVPPASKLRKAIAKRDWKKALEAAEEDPESRTIILRTIRHQLEWALQSLDRGDPIVAGARLEALRKLPKGEFQAEWSALDERASKDKALKAIGKEQDAVLKLASELSSSIRYGMRYLSDGDYRALDRAVSKLTERSLSPVPAKMLESVAAVLHRYSPFQPCGGCGRELGDCNCG